MPDLRREGVALGIELPAAYIVIFEEIGSFCKVIDAVLVSYGILRVGGGLVEMSDCHGVIFAVI